MSTHDQIEAMTLASWVVVMNQGRIEQVGPPQELCRAPATKFVAGFIGSPAMNFIPCRLERHEGRLLVVFNEATALAVPAAFAVRYAPHIGRPLEFGLRPEHLTEPRGRDDIADLRVMVEVVVPMGREALLYVRVAGSEAIARIDPAHLPGPGDEIVLSAHLNHMHLLDPETGLVL